MSMQSDAVGQVDDLDAVLKIISDLGRKSASGNYIYRGEPKCFSKVSSSLFRQYDEIENENFDIETVQMEILKEAQKYTSETEPFEVLTQLQHYGGKTNLIDFTTDYLVALFFACDGSPDKDGRVILLKKSGEMKPHIKEPRNTNNRVIAQKSIFVQPPEGLVQPDEKVTVPRLLKRPLLDYLRSAHGISTASIYKDIFGFIKHQNLHQSTYTEFYKGLTAQSKEELEEAIVHYSESIRLNPQRYETYMNRGSIYITTGELDLAIRDFDSAIALNPELASAYVGRGLARRQRGDVEIALSDYNKALELEPDNARAHSFRGIAYEDKSLPAFAMADHNKAVELEPENILCYVNRGAAYAREGATGLAIEDFDRALELDPDNATALYNRGEAWLCLAEWEKARSDLISARDTGMDVVSSFHNEFKSVSDFEQRFGLKIPEDIAEMLGG